MLGFFRHRICFRLFLFMAGLILADGSAFDLGAAETPSPGAGTRPDYVLQPLDLIKIEIFQEPDLTRELRLTQEAAIALPLIGTINLKNKTVREAEALLRVLYDRDYLVNPQINLSVLQYAKRSVDVLGAVASAGTIDIPAEQQLNLLNAVARAGGFTRLADRRKVRLTRMGEEGKSTTFEINADDILRSNTEDQWLLQPGDVIYVPERLL